MNNQQILEKAIQKAIDGGWYSFANDAFGKITIDDILLRYNPHGQGLEWTVKGHESNWSLIEALIFSHDFAKALWLRSPEIEAHLIPPIDVNNYKDRPYVAVRVDARRYPAWQYHLQQMVIADDPIKYLGKNI